MPMYDSIAEAYQGATGLTLFEVAGYSLISRLDDLAGAAVLDLACGEGNQSRRIKMAGARQVLGVDISPEMLRLAESEEERTPLGIEYECSAVQHLGAVGRFDYVTAAFLLHYAPSYADLVAMCRSIYANLVPGRRFVTINENCGRFTQFPTDAFARYGFKIEVCNPPLAEGGSIRVTLTRSGRVVQFDNYYYSRATYESALREVGFAAVQWSPLRLPPRLADSAEASFWDFFLRASPLTVLECTRP